MSKRIYKGAGRMAYIGVALLLVGIFSGLFSPTLAKIGLVGGAGLVVIAAILVFVAFIFRD